AFIAKHRFNQDSKLLFHLRIFEPVFRVPERIIDSSRQSSTIRKIYMYDVRDRAGIHRAQLRITFHLHVLQKFPHAWMTKALAVELFVGYFAVDQRDRRNVSKAVSSRSARCRLPFLRLTAD